MQRKALTGPGARPRRGMRALATAAALAAALLLACSDSEDNVATDGGPAEGGTCTYPDSGIPGSCAKSKLTVFKGQYQLTIDKLEMGGLNEGFDLNNEDCDSDPKTGVDNVLWVLSALANPSLEESMKKGEVILPFEFFDLTDATSDTCLNFAIYFGRFPPDYDEDGEKAGGPASKPGKDCNDADKDISPKSKEVTGNGTDDDCDGLADEDESTSPATPSSDATDADGDGQTIAAGDCDDRKGKGEKIKKGGKETCGDGLDNDCNGYADDGCMPWTSGTQFPLESLSLNKAGDEGLITFKGARISDGKLSAGPSIFSLTIQITKGMTLEMKLTHVFVQANIMKEAAGLYLKNGLLSGVLGAQAMDQAPNLLKDLYGNEDDTLLDVMVGPAGLILALPQDKSGNVIPDIDVDGDGLESFLDKDLDGDKDNFRVDTCIDGDGTIIKDKYDSAGKVTAPCTMAKDSKGNYRFQDGWSVTLKFDASPAKLKGTVQTTTP